MKRPKGSVLMNKYILGLLLIAHNVCAMELEVVNNEKKSSVVKLFKKYSQNVTLPSELQKNIFVMMHEKYNAEKEKFIEEKVCEFKFFIDRSNKVDWSITVELKDDYVFLLKDNLRQLLNKAEHHSFCQKNNKGKALGVYGCNYIMNTQHLKNYNRFPMNLEIVDVTERLTNFVKEYYDPIIMFWYIVHTKQGRL